MFPFILVNGGLVGTLDLTDVIASNGNIQNLFYTLTRTTTTLIGNQIAVNVAGINYLICNNAVVLNIQGLAGGIEGQELLIAVSNANVALFNEFAGALAVNRMVNNVGGASVVITRGAFYVYRSNRWRLMWQD